MAFWAFSLLQVMFLLSLSVISEPSIWNLVIIASEEMLQSQDGIQIILNGDSKSFPISANRNFSNKKIIISFHSLDTENLRNICLSYRDDTGKPENVALINLNSSEVINCTLNKSEKTEFCWPDTTDQLEYPNDDGSVSYQINDTSGEQNNSFQDATGKATLSSIIQSGSSQDSPIQLENKSFNFTEDFVEKSNNVTSECRNSSTHINCTVVYQIPLSGQKKRTKYIGFIVSISVLLCIVVLNIKILLSKKNNRCNKRTAFENEADNLKLRQMLHENSDADEKISVDNELYMSSENLLFVDETLRYGIKEFHRNPETTPREQTKREINATERKPALLREHDKQVTDTSNDDELYVNISSTLETDAEIYEDHILQETNTEIPFPESQLKMSKTDLKTSNQKLEHEVKVEYSDATFQYKILNKTLSQRNEYEASVNDKEFVDESVQDDPEGIMIESKKYTTKSQKKDFINPHSCNYPENTSFISNKSYLDEEEGEDDYAELEDMKNENKDYFSESQKEDFVDPHLGIDPENIPYTLNPSCIDEEFVDNCIYGNPEEIMCKSKDYSQESQKKDFADPPSVIDPQNTPTPYTLNPSCIDEEFVDNCIYGNPEEIMCKSKDYSQESQKKDFVDPHSVIDPQNTPYKLNPSCIDEEFVDNCIYGNPEEIMCKSKDYSQESQKKDFVDPHSVIDPQNTPYKLNPSCIDEEFVDNCIYGNPEEIMCKSKDYSQESQKKDFVDPHSVIDPQNTPYKLNPSCIDEEFVDNCIYGNPEEIMCKSKDYSQEFQKEDFRDPYSCNYPENTSFISNKSYSYGEIAEDDSIYADLEDIRNESKGYSQESQKKDFVDPPSVIDPQNTPYNLNPSCIDEEFVDNCIYGNPEEIMCKSKDYSQESQKKDFWDPHSCNYPENTSFISNKSYLDEEEGEDDYAELEDMKNENKDYSSESQIKDFVYPHLGINPGNTPYTLNPSGIDEEFVDNCIYGNPEEIMCKSKDYSQESQKKDFWGPHSCNYPENTSFISNKSYLDEEEGEDDYAELEDMKNENKDYSQESQKKDFAYPPSVIDPQNTPYTLNPSCIDEEFVDNCIYGNPEEIMCKSKDYSQESQKKDFVDPHSVIDPQNTPYKLNPSCIDEEFVDNCIYGNPEEIMCKSKDYSQESQKKDFVDPIPSNY